MVPIQMALVDLYNAGILQFQLSSTNMTVGLLLTCFESMADANILARKVRNERALSRACHTHDSYDNILRSVKYFSLHPRGIHQVTHLMRYL